MDDAHLINKKTLVESLKKGDFEAFDRLFWCYQKRLYHFALSILKDNEDARDVVQEAFLRIWKNRENLDEQSSLQSFLFTISYNIIVDTMRKKVSDRNFRDYLQKNAIDKESQVEKEVEFNELRTIYNNAVEELPLERKKIYKLQRFENMKYEEIADQLELSVNTVRSQMYKAISYLRKRIGGHTLAGLLFLSLFV
ncbi:MAG: RNA polymerase sigma factor [Bacteroidales bacterium]